MYALFLSETSSTSGLADERPRIGRLSPSEAHKKQCQIPFDFLPARSWPPAEASLQVVLLPALL